MSKTALLVDDSFSIRQMLSFTLKDAGFDVIEGGNGQEGLTKVQQATKLDLIITDLNMEREDIGLEVARAAMALNPKPVVVICTGFAGAENAQAALEMKVDYLATKPTDLAQLTSTLYALLRRRASSMSRSEVPSSSVTISTKVVGL